VPVNEFTEKEKEMLNTLVLNIKTDAAFDELERREAKAQQEKIVAIRKELFGV